MQLQVKRRKFKKSIGFMKWQEVYFDIVSAIGHTLQGLMSVSKLVHTYFSPKPTIKSTDKFGLQVRVNFGLGEEVVHNRSDHSLSYSHLHLITT